MADILEEQKSQLITEMSLRQLGQVLLAGFVIGAVVGGLTLLLSTYLFKVTPCVAETCSTGGQYSAILAGIIGGAAALFFLMRIQIFRPLLVVIGVTISLWGIGLYILNWPWYGIVLASAGLHAVAYGLLAWVSRIRFFWVVLVISLAVIVGTRLILAS